MRVSIAETRRRPSSRSKLRREFEPHRAPPKKAKSRSNPPHSFGQAALSARSRVAERRVMKEPRRMTRKRTTNRLMQSGVAGQSIS